MANLETLSITIDASAEKAQQGINGLVGSLRSLAKGLGTVIPSLKTLNSELKTLANTKLTNLGKSINTDAVKKAQKLAKVIADGNRSATAPQWALDAQKQNDSWTKQIKAKPEDPNKSFWENHPDAYNAARQSAMASKQAAAERMAQNEAKRLAFASASEQPVKKVASDISNLNKELNKNSTEFKKAESSAKSFNGVISKLGSRIAKMAQTMLIRMAIRSLIKGAQEGLKNYYQYSKAIGSQYGKTYDEMIAKSNQLKNQTGAAIGNLLVTVYPVLKAIADAAIYAFNGLTALFALLNGDTSYSQATYNIQESLEQSGKAAKGLLASFDELNVITSQTSSSGTGIDYSEMFQEVALPQWLLEWKPIIEAVILGTGGALLLPKIFEWIKKIFGLGTEPGADGIINMFKNMLKMDGDFNLPDLSTFNSQLATTAALAPTAGAGLQAMQEAFAAMTTFPDLSGFNTQVGLTATESALAAAGISAMAEAFVALKTALTGLGTFDAIVELLKNLPGLLLQTLGDKTLKVKIDTEEYDNAKKEIEKWASETLEKKVVLKVPNVYKDDNVKNFDTWASTAVEKTVTLSVPSISKNENAVGIGNWATSKVTKEVLLSVPNVNKNENVKNYQAWVTTQDTKSVKLSVPLVSDNANAVGIGNWAAKDVTKKVLLSVPDIYKNTNAINLGTWLTTSETKSVTLSIPDCAENSNYKKFNKWVGETDTKSVEISFPSHILDPNIILYNTFIGIVDEKDVQLNFPTLESNENYNKFETWVNTAAKKKISYTVPNIKSNANKKALDKWAKDGYTVKVKVEFSLTNIAGTLKSLVDEVILKPIRNGFKKVINVFIDAINDNFIKPINSLGSVYIPHFEISLPVIGSVTLLEGGWKRLWGEIDPLEKIPLEANGAYGIPKGQLFIANEAGAELVGSMNGKTTVANQEQIIEGISRGVSDANSEQNALLRQQNELLRGILQKEWKFGASSAFGRVAKQSLDMYGAVTGG